MNEQSSWLTPLTMLSALTLLGATTYLLYHRNKSTRKIEPPHQGEDFDVVYARMRRFAEMRDFGTSHTKIYFDSSDEFLNEASLPELLAIRSCQNQEYLEERAVAVKHKISCRYHSVVCDFSDGDDYMSTRRGFTSDKVSQNALSFLDQIGARDQQPTWIDLKSLSTQTGTYEQRKHVDDILNMTGNNAKAVLKMQEAGKPQD